MPRDLDYNPFEGLTSGTTAAPTASKVDKKKKSGQNLVSGQWIVFKPTPAPGSTAEQSSTTSRKRNRTERDETQDTGSWREEHCITVEGDAPEPMRSFDHLPSIAKGFVRRALDAQGFLAPTPIQAQAWPIVLSKRQDVVGIAKTGSGKTLAFMIPAIAMLDAEREAAGPKACVLCPTRELAQQILDETVKVVPPSVRVVCVYGGTPKGPQLAELGKGCDIVVATPGRLIDFLNAQKTSVQHVKYLVLDEADRMLDMGFEPQVKEICSMVPTGRQTLMFSATWPKEVQNLASTFMKSFVRVNIGSTKLQANPDISQHFIFCQDSSLKINELRKIIACRPGIRILVFVNMKTTADTVDQHLRKTGVPSQSIHGDKDQSQREYILHRFKQQKTGVLIATDVAARGLDIKSLECVVNYDFPSSIHDYVHRIGRTGRAGAKGDAITLLLPREKNLSPPTATELVDLLETAGQTVPPQIREKSAMAALHSERRTARVTVDGAIVKYKHSVKAPKKVAKGTTLFGVKQ